jgi:hypothetical protein
MQIYTVYRPVWARASLHFLALEGQAKPAWPLAQVSSTWGHKGQAMVGLWSAWAGWHESPFSSNPLQLI